MTNRDILDKYRQYLLLHGHPAGTVEQYTSYPRRLLADMDEPAALIDIDTIAAWFTSFDWSPNTQRRANGSLRLFFEWLRKHGNRPDSPMDAMKRVRGARSIPRPCPDADLIAALRKCRHEDAKLVILGAETGLRRAEIAQVHSDDVERHAHGYWLRVKGKGRKMRMVPISESTALWVRSANGWRFPSPTRPGEHVIPSVIGKRIRRALNGWTPHTLRHRFATVAYAESQDILAVQAILGHESVATTQIYIKVADERLRSVAQGAALPRVA